MAPFTTAQLEIVLSFGLQFQSQNFLLSYSSLMFYSVVNVFCLLRLTWWIPRTACLIEVGCVGGSRRRIPSWIACKKSQARKKNIRNHSLANTEGHRRVHTHTHRTGRAVFGLEQDVHRWRSLKKMSAPITRSAECVLHTDEPHLPIRCGRR